MELTIGTSLGLVIAIIVLLQQNSQLRKDIAVEKRLSVTLYSMNKFDQPVIPESERQHMLPFTDEELAQLEAPEHET